jgi:hypothetical protein
MANETKKQEEPKSDVVKPEEKQQKQQKPQKPSVCRMVHYQTDDTEAAPMAAIISEVDELGTVTLAIFNPQSSGVSYKRHVAYAEVPTPGHWNYPPRV